MPGVSVRIGINLIEYLRINCPENKIIVIDNQILGKKKYIAGFDVELNRPTTHITIFDVVLITR